MMNMNNMVPVEVLDKLEELRAKATSGTMQLDVKDGRILSFKVTEFGRVRSSKARPLEPYA